MNLQVKNFRVADVVTSAFMVYLWYNPPVHLALARMMF